MADITPRKRDIVLLRFRNTKTTSEQPLQVAKGMQDDEVWFTENLMRAGVHVSSRIVRWHLLEAGRNTKNRLKGDSYS